MRTMHDPAHPGESLRDAMAAEGWTVTEAAAKLGCTRQDLLVGAERESHPLWRWHWNESGGAMQRFGCAARRRRLGAGTYPPGTCMRWTRPAREPHLARSRAAVRSPPTVACLVSARRLAVIIMLGFAVDVDPSLARNACDRA